MGWPAAALIFLMSKPVTLGFAPLAERIILRWSRVRVVLAREFGARRVQLTHLVASIVGVVRGDAGLLSRGEAIRDDAAMKQSLIRT